MTREDASGHSSGPEAVAIAYLEAHPDLLLRHPSLLAKLEVPHGGDGAVSLVERQLSVLREQVAQERGRLACLVERAREYEALSTHLHQLTTKLILARSLAQMQDVLDAELKAEFGAEAVALNTLPTKDPEQASDQPVSPTLLKLVELGRCLCGTLSEAQYADLFGRRAKKLQSAALIPLKGPKVRGVLAIGSRDPNHFTADMGTEVLERLGDIISAKLLELAMLPHD